MKGGPVSFWDGLLMGYVAEAATVPVTLPFEAIATRLQTSSNGFFEAVRDLWKNSKYGIDGFYKSMYAYLILNWQSAIVNTIFNSLKALVVSIE